MNNRDSLLKIGSSDEEKLLIARCLDKAQLAESSWEPVLGDFCDPQQLSLLRRVFARRDGEAQIFFSGGYAHAERVRLCFARPSMAPEDDEFSIEVMKISGDSRFFTPAHRDVLGAVMNLGIRREKIGDVVIHAGNAYVILDSALTAHVTLDSIGKASVTTELVGMQSLESYCPRFSSHTVIAASFRLDAVIAAVYKLSRSVAADAVSRGLVKLNHTPCLSGSKEVKPGDMLSVRGYGRAYIREDVGKTQKDRLRLRVEKPI